MKLVTLYVDRLSIILGWGSNMTDSINLDWYSTLGGDIHEDFWSITTVGIGLVVYTLVVVGCGGAPSDSGLKQLRISTIKESLLGFKFFICKEK